MKEAYPETFLRGLSGKTAVTEEGYVLSEAFQFSENKERTEDGMHEMSVNWEDENNAVDQLLGQKRKDSEELQFNIGFSRFTTSKLKEWFGTHIKKGDFSYERRPVEGNPYHGNLLASPTIKPTIKRNITCTLANMATADLYLRNRTSSPYKSKEVNNEIEMTEEKTDERKRSLKISVVVPVYGVEKYIERCARSLFEQTLDDLEFLFIDDCSPDKSIDVLRRVLEDYPQRKHQVIIHRMEKNSGQAKVREWGMKNATGEYVIHCDSDDWVDTDAYNQLYNTATSTNADIVFFDYYKSDEKKHTAVNRLQDAFMDKYDVIKLLLATRLTGSVCLALFKRSLYQKNFTFPMANMGEDLAMMLQMVYNSNNSITYLPQPLYYYQDNLNSISKSVSEDNIIRKLMDNMENGNLMFDFLNRMGLGNTMSLEIELYKFAVRKNLYPLLGRSNYYKKWRACYPEINYSFLSNKRAEVDDKLRFISCYLCCYHILGRFKQLISR